MLKTLIIGLLLVGAMGVALEFGYNSDVEVIKETETVIQVETVDSLEDRIKTAQEAAQSVTEDAAQALYNEYVEKEMKRIEDEVKIEYIGEIEQTIEDPAY